MGVLSPKGIEEAEAETSDSAPHQNAFCCRWFWIVLTFFSMTLGFIMIGGKVSEIRSDASMEHLAAWAVHELKPFALAVTMSRPCGSSGTLNHLLYGNHHSKFTLYMSLALICVVLDMLLHVVLTCMAAMWSWPTCYKSMGLGDGYAASYIFAPVWLVVHFFWMYTLLTWTLDCAEAHTTLDVHRQSVQQGSCASTETLFEEHLQTQRWLDSTLSKPWKNVLLVMVAGELIESSLRCFAMVAEITTNEADHSVGSDVRSDIMNIGFMSAAVIGFGVLIACALSFPAAAQRAQYKYVRSNQGLLQLGSPVRQNVLEFLKASPCLLSVFITSAHSIPLDLSNIATTAAPVLLSVVMYFARKVAGGSAC